MDELVGRQENMPAILDSYAQQGRMFLFNAAQNLIQYGRVLVEAKPLVPHGQFEKWVQDNFGMSERSAQGYMAVWRRFGSQEQFQAIQFSNLQKMLSLPKGTEQQFAEENDLQNMTAREVEKAVQKVREETQNEIDRERKARRDAERRARELEEKGIQSGTAIQNTISEKDALIDRYRMEIDQQRRIADQANREKAEAIEELQDAKRDLLETEELLAENQQEYNRMQAELLNAQSAIAKGDAERTISEQLTGEDFAAAVRNFLGSVAQMPYMGGTFAQISDMREYRQWDELLTAVEDWTARARKALTTVDGGVVNG